MVNHHRPHGPQGHWVASVAIYNPPLDFTSNPTPLRGCSIVPNPLGPKGLGGLTRHSGEKGCPRFGTIAAISSCAPLAIPPMKR
jgi:hypothetical protein